MQALSSLNHINFSLILNDINSSGEIVLNL